MLRRQVIGVAIILGIIGVILIDTWLQAHPTQIAYASNQQVELKKHVVLIATHIDWTPERIENEIDDKAVEYGVSATLMRKIIECESQGSTTVQSYARRNGKRENSWGLVQIFLDAHPHITKEQALDPKFAIDFLAKNIQAGRANMWSCYRLIK